MATCTDPFVDELNSKGYHLLAYPKTSVKTLHVYQSTLQSKALRMFVKTDVKPMSGFIRDMFINPEGGIGQSKGKGIGVDTVITQKINSEVSTSLITNYINSLLPDEEKKISKQQINAMFSNTQSVVFKLENIETIDVNELALRNWLNANQNKLNKIYESDIKAGTLYVATSLLSPKKITMTLERNNSAKYAAEFADLLNLPLTAKLSHATENARNDKLLYDKPDKGMVIAIRLVRLQYSPKGILTFDNKQDFDRTLNHEQKLEPELFKTDETFIDIE
jgi:hypothetical protein